MSGASSRQSQMVADEMFPDGPGPLDFVDVEDGVRGKCFEIGLPTFLALGHCWNVIPDLKHPPKVRDGVAGGPAGLLSELTASEKTVHADFYNGFGDLFDDNDLN